MGKVRRALIAVSFLMCLPFSAHATLITYTVEQLNSACDAWQYHYGIFNDTPDTIFSLALHVSGPSPDEYFRQGDISSVEGLPDGWGRESINNMWTFESLDDRNGFHMTDDDIQPGDTWRLSVSFVSYAAGMPGSQQFDVVRHSLSSPDVFTTEHGETIPAPVPEPTSLLVFASGLFFLSGLGRRKGGKG